MISEITVRVLKDKRHYSTRAKKNLVKLKYEAFKEFTSLRRITRVNNAVFGKLLLYSTQENMDYTPTVGLC